MRQKYLEARGKLWFRVQASRGKWALTRSAKIQVLVKENKGSDYEILIGKYNSESQLRDYLSERFPEYELNAKNSSRYLEYYITDEDLERFFTV